MVKLHGILIKNYLSLLVYVDFCLHFKWDLIVFFKHYIDYV